ncbi:MAG: PQQ-binding-like beta-propeller repeat protein [Pseudomonadales bacterium]|jgi:polyvinyl alcohol dehydrogenase (cytochrome)|nr:PQQ-binding-like beta-propeller repeat protein [Pseudomonadales bacterium]
MSARIRATLFRAFFRVLLPLLCALLTPLGALAAACSAPPDLNPSADDWSGWGNGLSNTRHAPEGLSGADLPNLQLRWAYGFEDAQSVVGQPVVQGSLLVIGVDTGKVQALDANSGCEYWSFQAPDGVRTAPALGQVDGEWRVFFGDRGAVVYALEALSGQLRWQREVDAHPSAILTGSPQFIALPGSATPERLLVPVSSGEEGAAAAPNYACCSFRGSVLSLDAANGELLWQTYTIAQTPEPTGEGSIGPSGGAIWSAPTVDLANGRVYVATGDAYSKPVTIGTDALMGLDLDTGRILWINQGTADDYWTVTCMRPGAAEDCGPDQDYGSPAQLVDIAGTPTLVAGQKSGMVRAFTPQGGSILWQRPLVEDTTQFGGKIIWGGASDGERAYFGLGTGGVAAVNLSDGALLWFTPMSPSQERATHPGQDGPLTVSGDLVFSGGWDGILRALDATSGAVRWEYDTAVNFDTVNDVAAQGGSLGAAGPVMAGRRLFVPSGYIGVKNGMKGNALLMFAP